MVIKLQYVSSMLHDEYKTVDFWCLGCRLLNDKYLYFVIHKTRMIIIFNTTD